MLIFLTLAGARSLFMRSGNMARWQIARAARQPEAVAALAHRLKCIYALR